MLIKQFCIINVKRDGKKQYSIKNRFLIIKNQPAQNLFSHNTFFVFLQAIKLQIIWQIF